MYIYIYIFATYLFARYMDVANVFIHIHIYICGACVCAGYVCWIPAKCVPICGTTFDKMKKAAEMEALVQQTFLWQRAQEGIDSKGTRRGQ